MLCNRVGVEGDAGQGGVDRVVDEFRRIDKIEADNPTALPDEMAIEGTEARDLQDNLIGRAEIDLRLEPGAGHG